MISVLKKWFRKKEVPRVSKNDMLILEYKNLKLDRLKKVFSSDMSIIQITVCKETIEHYISHLKYISAAFENGYLLSATATAVEAKDIYIRDFYISNHNVYLKPEIVTELFIEYVIRFLTLYESAEKSADKSFNIGKNLFLCGPIVSNLSTLLQSFKSL